MWPPLADPNANPPATYPLPPGGTRVGDGLGKGFETSPWVGEALGDGVMVGGGVGVGSACVAIPEASHKPATNAMAKTRAGEST
jgi:hypothetical protein